MKEGREEGGREGARRKRERDRVNLFFFCLFPISASGTVCLQPLFFLSSMSCKPIFCTLCIITSYIFLSFLCLSYPLSFAEICFGHCTQPNNVTSCLMASRNYEEWRLYFSLSTVQIRKANPCVATTRTCIMHLIKVPVLFEQWTNGPLT